jgi:hypothetical protein
MATVAELLVKIGGNADGLRKEIQASQRQLKRAFGPEALDASSKMAAGLGVITAAAGAAAVAAGKMAVSWNLAVNAIEDVTGMSGEAASRLLAVGQMVGLSGEDMSAALVKMSKSAEAAFESIKENGANSTDAYTKFGIAVQDSNGNMLSAEQIYANVAARHREMANGVEKTAMEMAIFGKKGAALNDLLNLTTDQMDDLTGRAEKMGLVVNSETSQAWESATFELNRAKLGFTAAGNAVLSDLLPAISSGTTAVADFLEAFAVDTKMNGITKALANLIPPEMVPAIYAVSGAVTAAMIPALYRMGLAAAAAMAPLAPLLAVGAALGVVAFGVANATEETYDFASGWYGASDAMREAGDAAREAGKEDLSLLYDELSNVNAALPELEKNATKTAGALASGAGAKGAAKAYNELAKAAEQAHKEIYREWVQLTKSQMEQLDIWRQDEDDKLEKSKTANANYERDKTMLAETYSARRKKILEDEAAASTAIFREARDRMTAMGNVKASIGLEGVQKEKFDLDTGYKDQITKIGDYYDDLTTKFANGTQQQKDDFIKQWTEAGYAFKVNEQGMVDFSAQKKAEQLTAEQKYLQDVSSLRMEYRAYEDALDQARRDGNMAAFAAQLETESALMYQDLAGRQEMIDAYYTIWQDTHRSAMSYMAEAMMTFYNGATTALTDIFTGAKSASEAFTDLGKSIVKMLAQWVAQQIAGQLAMMLFGKAMQATQIAAAKVAGAATAAAWAPAAAMVSLATFGANSVPAMAGIGATVGMSLGLSISQLASGGITTGPTIAEIGERGKEAVLPLNRRAFEKAGLVGKSQAVTVNQHNYGDIHTDADLDAVNIRLGRSLESALAGGLA